MSDFLSKFSVDYAKSCINDESCSSLRREAAVLDYVGAVYGEEGKVDYDGILKVEEYEYVKIKFGELSYSGELQRGVVYNYIRVAQQILYMELQIPVMSHNQCNNKNAYKMDNIENVRLGKAVFLAAPHDCGLEIGGYYLDKGLELAVAANPKEWVFFVEGALNTHDVTAYELSLFQRISKALKLPLTNPLKHNFSSPEVALESERRFGRPRIDYIATYLIMAFYNFGTKDRVELWSSNLDRLSKLMATIHDIDSTDLKKAFFKLVKRNEGEAELDYWNRLSSDVNLRQTIDRDVIPLTDEALLVSNTLNVSVVRTALQAHPSRKHAFFQIGTLHMSLVNNIYSE